jgi:glutamate---methylamine ligase
MADNYESSCGDRAESGFTDLDPDRDELPLAPPVDSSLDLEELANERGIKYFMVSYTTLNSDSRVAIIPKRSIRDVQRRGCGVPAAMFFKADGADPEMNIVPDPKTLIQLPWKPEYGWLSRSEKRFMTGL